MMKQIKNADILTVETLKSKIWSMFDVIRRESISSEDYHVLLFLLSAYKDGIFNNEIFNDPNDLRERLIKYLRNIESKLANRNFSIISIFEPIVSQLSLNGLGQILNSLYKLDTRILHENFPEVFDSVLYRIVQSQGKFGGEFMQPFELSRFICHITELQPNSKIYNPFAGIASFGLYFEQGQDYFGQELNQKTWAIGILRILAYGRTSIFKYTLDDSILHWPNSSEKFDLIISNPPLGLRKANTRSFEHMESFWDSVNNNYINGERPPILYRTIEQFLIDNGVRSLNEKGKLIAIMSQGFLFKGSQDLRLRKFLVEEDLIDTIISLPGGLLYNTGIPLTIMVLNRKKLMPGKIKFIDAKKFVDTKNPREKVFNDQKLINFLNNNESDLDVARYISIEKVRDFDYNLSVPRYFQQEIDGVKLGEIIEIIRGQRRNLPATGKLIRIRDLKEDNIDFLLDETTITNIELNRTDIHEINQSCLLLSARWNSLKPTFFEYKGDSIYRNQDILSFNVNENIADKGYLINELNSDYVKKQLDSFRIGSTIPFIRKDDLLEVVIKLPSIEEQRAKIQGIHELSDKIKNLQAERNALAHGKSLKQFSEFASLKHTLGRPRQNILDWSDNLLDFLNSKSEGFERINKSFAEFYDTDIITALKEIKRDVNFITDVLEKGENGFVLSEYEITTIPLTDINSLINELSNIGLNFKIKKLLLNSEMLKDRGVYANRTLFKTLIDNILTNAIKYAFNKKVARNEVIIELTEIDDFLSIEFKNNGNSFPKNFDRDKFITKYSTANSTNGSGLGGYDINRIATYFYNPNWELILNEDPFYPVKFKFLFPIKLIN